MGRSVKSWNTRAATPASRVVAALPALIDSVQEIVFEGCRHYVVGIEELDALRDALTGQPAPVAAARAEFERSAIKTAESIASAYGWPFRDEKAIALNKQMTADMKESTRLYAAWQALAATPAQGEATADQAVADDFQGELDDAELRREKPEWRQY